LVESFRTFEERRSELCSIGLKVFSLDYLGNETFGCGDGAQSHGRSAENPGSRTTSGSYQEGVNVPIREQILRNAFTSEVHLLHIGKQGAHPPAWRGEVWWVHVGRCGCGHSPRLLPVPNCHLFVTEGFCRPDAWCPSRLLPLFE